MYVHEAGPMRSYLALSRGSGRGQLADLAGCSRRSTRSQAAAVTAGVVVVVVVVVVYRRAAVSHDSAVHGTPHEPEHRTHED